MFNVVCGLGPKAGEPLVKHPDVRVVSFTGSTAVGEKIAALAAPQMKKLSLELGGKNAAIVFADADLKKVVPTLLRSSFINQGEQGDRGTERRKEKEMRYLFQYCVIYSVSNFPCHDACRN